jgi:hypothetical protein
MCGVTVTSQSSPPSKRRHARLLSTLCLVVLSVEGGLARPEGGGADVAVPAPAQLKLTPRPATMRATRQVAGLLEVLFPLILKAGIGGGEGGIRSLPAPLESVSYRNHVAAIAMNAAAAVGHSPPVPGEQRGDRLIHSTSGVTGFGHSKTMTADRGRSRASRRSFRGESNKPATRRPSSRLQNDLAARSRCEDNRSRAHTHITVSFRGRGAGWSLEARKTSGELA